MSQNCKSCGAANVDEARFCRLCGKMLAGSVSVPEPSKEPIVNVINLYPEYKFMPASMVTLGPPFKNYFYAFIFGVLGLVAIGAGIGCLGSRSTNEYAPVCFAAAIVLLIVFFIFRHKCRRREIDPDVADYVQGKGSPYRYFVKNHKFGLLNVSTYKVQIPALYNEMRRKDKKGQIYVVRDGADTYEIDINGNRLN